MREIAPAMEILSFKRYMSIRARFNLTRDLRLLIAQSTFEYTLHIEYNLHWFKYIYIFKKFLFSTFKLGFSCAKSVHVFFKLKWWAGEAVFLRKIRTKSWFVKYSCPVRSNLSATWQIECTRAGLIFLRYLSQVLFNSANAQTAHRHNSIRSL